ncbi:hypothetical protein IW967_05430 [Alicyclobacillus mali]|uniref:Uncharacterized protein n=1 Tax=Alicyclobacillus mali (ex Roth et al. 2021) TaxID=1123961 RepID=A0ABS0F201_9BACL|nr:hypothetical protein [Alicyclobacillus mali (ex Roth et al. 2021)]MBF8377312.1 hypothetical protein [Alicyclobacillus mali (ex Roth et al. 2021)]MCL6488063.1 hypothetical protein [Alicyclobacillus mali (ex Roth et al. 2021)]
MKFVYWLISAVIVLGGCYYLYQYIRRQDSVESRYYRLLKQLPNHPDDEALRREIFAVGRKFYRNRKSGIDDAIRIDMEQAIAGELKTPEDYQLQ